MKYPLSKAAKLAGISRAQIYKIAKSGKLSVELDGLGQKVIDASELYRVFPEAQSAETQETVANVSIRDDRTQTKDNDNTVLVDVLQRQIQDLKAEREADRRERDRLLGIIEGHARLLQDLRPAPAQRTWIRKLFGG